jgi:hypothetical protein
MMISHRGVFKLWPISGWYKFPSLPQWWEDCTPRKKPIRHIQNHLGRCKHPLAAIHCLRTRAGILFDAMNVAVALGSRMLGSVVYL